MEKQPLWSRSPTLRVVGLLSTRLQSARLELVGDGRSTFARMGTLLVYLPLLVIGYLLMLASLVKLVASALGWGMTLFVFGMVHVAVSLWGISQGRQRGSARTYEVVEPAVAESVRARGA